MVFVKCVNRTHLTSASTGREFRPKMKNFLGPRIRELRRAARPKVTQEDLAGRLAALGLLIDRSAVSRIENRDRILTDIELIGIARALRLPVSEFFGEPRSYPLPVPDDRKVAEPGTGRGKG